MSRSGRDDEGRARRASSARHAARGPPRRAALRQAVAPDALDLLDRGARAGRRHASSRRRRRARRPRDDRGRRAQPRALGLRRRHPHVRAGAAAALRRRRAGAARRQRADRRGTSLPGAGGLPDAHRALGLAARPHDRVRRRRQQRRGVARAGGRDARRHASSSRRRRASSCRRPCSDARRVASRGSAAASA